METLLAEYLEQVWRPFFDPQKRVFWGYLLAAVLIALAVAVFAEKSTVRAGAARFFARPVWWSKSARADYFVLLINQAAMLGIAPRLATKLALATAIFEGLHIWFDGRLALAPAAPGWAIASSFTLVVFLLDDGAKYLLHRALHRWPVLWAFHRTHHSAETLTPFTVYRTHPVEGVLFALRAVVVQATAVAAFVFFFGDRASLVTVLGANAVLFAFNIAGANLRHSHVWISYGRFLERILISPAQHQIHHSRAPEHRDRNFGAVLAIWDWIGGSLTLAGRRRSFTFGIGDGVGAPHGLRALYLDPFIRSARTLAEPIAKGRLQVSRFPFPKLLRRVTLAAIALLTAGLAVDARAAEDLNVYSHRQPFLIQPFIDAYTAETGVKVNIVYASRGLAQRLQAEGARSPADVILTVDIARLHVYADKDLLAPVASPTLNANVPAHLRDPGGRWFAFSKRARVIAVSKRATDALQIARYEDLADPKWRGRICSRPGSHVYNRALVASMIEADGLEAADAWAAGLVANLARRPQGNDRAQVKAVYEGECDIAIINNYYFGKLLNSDNPEQRAWADAVQLIFPNQGDRGAHVNISGGGMAKHSDNKAEAVRFLEFLTSKAAQDLYGKINFEYPVNPNVETSSELKSWGTFIEDQMPIARIAELAPEAQKVIDRARW